MRDLLIPERFSAIMYLLKYMIMVFKKDLTK
jgi:hypothetical protein